MKALTDSATSIQLDSLVALAVRLADPRAALDRRFAGSIPRFAAPDPRPDAVAGCLVNELEELEENLVVVLDDYHRIGGTAVHDLMDRLLRYPPRPLHLEIVARFDPPLSLGSLRARGQMSEIREHELRFTGAESKVFFDRALDSRPGPGTLTRLEEVTEGWKRVRELFARH
jgi:LuxR family maltose regulon positive regulatory protein